MTHSQAATSTGAGMRLEPRPGEVIDRNAPFTFTFNGRSYGAFRGDTIVSALAAAGERVFSRSFKYHRPRGVLTADFHDPGCILQVGDEPNVRAAHRLAEPGMRVSSQNTWPSLRFDVKAVNQLVGRFLAPGFYYKTFIKPQRLWPAYERVLQSFVHGGEVSPEVAEEYYDKRYAHPDVLIAGGGPAGMSAAVAAAQAGARVLLVDEGHALGGHLRWGDADERATAAELSAEVAAYDNVEVLTNSVVAGRYDDNWVAVVQRDLPDIPERLIKARAKTLVVAAGLIERPYVFSGNDIPGVLLSTAARRLVNMYAVAPGRRAVVLAANAAGDAAAADLEAAGVEIAHVADARKGGDVLRAHGRWGLQAVELPDGRKIECDLLVTATGWTAPTSLLNMAGDRPVYEPRAARFVPDPAATPDTVLPTGGIAGDGSLDELRAHARATGTEAARRAGRIARELRASVPTRPRTDQGERASAASDGSAPGGDSASEPGNSPELSELRLDDHPELFHGPTHGIVDFCEDVSSKDLATAVKEGYDSAELVKRYTTATMGPTQGKLETINKIGRAHV